MKRQRLIAAALAAVLLSAGCNISARDTSAPSSASEQGASMEVPLHEPEPTENSSPAGHDGEGIEAGEARFYPTERGFRWSEDGRHLVIRQGNVLRFLNLGNEISREVSFPYGAEDPTDPFSGYYYSWNENRMLVTRSGLHPGEETRIVERDGKLTLCNAAVYTMEGDLLREFPPPGQPLMDEDLERFEKSVRQCVQNVTWLDDDHFAVNIKTRVYIYDLAEDRLELVHDMIQAVREGYTIYDANAYGAFEHFWSRDGVYYYTACPAVPKDQKPRYSLYAADMENGSRLILPEIGGSEMLGMRDGKLLSTTYTGVKQPEGSPFDFAFDITVRILDLHDPVFRAVARYQSENQWPQWDGRRLIYDTIDYSVTPNRRVFTILDCETGEETSFCPGDLDDTQRMDGAYAYQLMAVLPGEHGNRYLHSIFDVREERENGEPFLRGYTYFYLYDEATGNNHLLEGSDLAWNNWSDDSVSPMRTHYVDGYDAVRILPFPA